MYFSEEMKVVLKYIFLSLLLLNNLDVLANRTQYSSYEGTHFFVGFMQNEITIDPRYGGLQLKLFIFPSSTTDITLIFPNDSVVNFYNVNSSRNLEINVPLKFECFESEVVQKKAIEILSTNPILVYGFSTQYLTSDAYTAIPVEKWGKEYVIISIANDQYNTLSDVYLDPADSLYRKTPRQSEFLIIGAYDSTEVTFYPKTITEKGNQAGYPKNITLHKGQTYLVKSFPFVKGYGDLSGTVVRGNKPFGVISGHVRTAIPQNLPPKWDSKNHICEMLMPTAAWGREFITVPFGTSALGDLIKITTYFSNTTITAIRNSGTQTYVLTGSYDVLEIPFVSEPTKWISDKPIQMAQFIMHSGSDFDSPNYDPAMTLVPPIEQFVTNVTFQTPANITWNPGQFVAHFVNIIGTYDALQETYLNSTKIVDITNNIYIFNLFNNTFFWANIQIPYGRYQIKTNKGKIAGIVYGVGLADAYALVLGSSLVNPYIGDSIPPELTFSAECGRIQGYFFEPKKEPNTGISYIYSIPDSTFNFSYFLNSITDTTTFAHFFANVIDPFKKGKIVIEVRDKNGNSKRFSYNYEPPSITITNELVFSQVKLYDTLQKPVVIKNSGKNINVLEISFANNDPRLRWYVNRKIPFNLTTNDSVSILITLSPNGNTQDLFDTLLVKTDCNLIYKVPIKVEFLIFKFLTWGFDFGKVYIGDTAIGKVGIVNLSDIPINFDSLTISTYPNIFILLNKGKFILKSQDTTYFDVKFIPNDRKEFVSNVLFFDELKQKPKAEIKGIGVAPLVESIKIDFGKVRVGKTKDTVVYIINKGNIDATVDFKNYDKFDSNFSGELELQNISFLDTLAVKLKFEPKSVGLKTQKAHYQVNWKFHPELSIELYGEGILPEIVTKDAIFDTILVYDQVSRDFPVVFSTGTDDLFINEIVPISGDFNSFEIDYSLLKDLFIPVGSVLTLPIKFKPDFVGAHVLELKVLSDATTSDSFFVSKINVIGYAKSRDTLNANLIVRYILPEFACNSLKLEFSVENTGNIPFPIYGTKFEFINFILTNSDTTITGKIVEPSKNIIGYFAGVPEKSGDVILKLAIIFGEHGDSVLYKEIQLKVPKIEQRVSIETDKSKLRIGEQYEVLLNGLFLKSSEIPFDLNLKIETNQPNQVTFLQKPLEIEFQDSKRAWKLQAQSVFKDNTVEITCQNVKIEEDKTQWFLRLPFQLFLTEYQKVKFNVEVDENHCFYSINSFLIVQIEPVCVYPLRDIELINGAFLINYYPNPVDDELILEFSSNKKDFVLMEIFDKLGNMIQEKIKIEVEVGKSCKKVDFSFMGNGIYFVKLHFFDRTKQLMVIKLK